MICPNLKNGICLLASELCQEDVSADERTCNQCGGSVIQNKYTVCLSAYHLGKNKDYNKMLNMWDKNAYRVNLANISLRLPNNKRLEDIVNGNGVGSQLWKILEKIEIKHSPSCPCLDWAERMNLWGPDGCRIARKEIVEHMTNSAKNYGWGDIAKAIAKSITTGLAFKLNPLDPYGSLLDEAVRLAEIQERKIPLEDGALND